MSRGKFPKEERLHLRYGIDLSHCPNHPNLGALLSGPMQSPAELLGDAISNLWLITNPISELTVMFLFALLAKEYPAHFAGKIQA